MEKMSHSVGFSQPTSPATLLSWLMNKVTTAAEMKVLQGLIVICLPGTSWLWLLQEPDMLIAEVNSKPLAWHNSQILTSHLLAR